MEYFTLFLISLSLCFDTFAVSVSCGLMVRRVRFWQAFRIATVFAVVQGAMPVLGWLMGRSVAPFVREYDHWMAFLLLALIGGKMIYESLKKKDEEEKDEQTDTLSVRRMLAMAIATSIDALIIGISFALIQMSSTRLTIAVLMLALVTGAASMLGMLIGKHSGSRFEKWAELIGGAILILIGVKVLLEHTVFNA